MNINQIRFYVSIFVRRSPYFGLVVAFATIIGILVAYILPPVYQAEAKILVESPQISTVLARSTVPEEIAKQLQRIELEMMARDNLLALANQFNLYDATSNLSSDDIADDMRANTKVEPIFLDTAGPGGASGFSISFKARDPVLAANVVNHFAHLFLQKNVSFRTGQAGGTLQFFQQEVEKRGKELRQLEGRLANFKDENRDTLPESLAFRQSRQISLQERLFQLDREEAAARDERAKVAETLLEEAGASKSGQSLKQQALEQFRRVLIEKRTIYSEQSSVIGAIQAQITALEQDIEQERIKASAPANKEKRTSEFDRRLIDVSKRLISLPLEKERLRREIGGLAETILKTPVTETALAALEREYQSAQAQYIAATARMSDAAIGQQIETNSKGERLSLLEEAVPPRKPVQPKRRLIAAGGLAAGVALGACLIALLELFGNTIRRPIELVKRLELEPLATIPFIELNSGSPPKR
jgi:polysaccharide biosynthesis transport protein